MAKKKIYFSYNYEKDENRVNEIRDMGVVCDIKPASKEEWNEICRQGDSSIKKWIDDHMREASVVVVFIGSDTDDRKWINYEIEKSWNEGKGLLGIYIHNIDDKVTGKCLKGKNPFLKFTMNRDGKNLRDVIKCYNPDENDPLNCIYEHINEWIDDALDIRRYY